MVITTKPIVFFDIDYTLYDTDVFKDSNLTVYQLYEEVKKVLQTLRQHVTIGIFSEGEDLLQKTKLQETQIHELFDKDHIYIVRNKENDMKKIFEKYKNDTVFLIDDKLSILHKMHSFFPQMKTIWVKRGKYALAAEPIVDFAPTAVVDDLRNVVSIVLKG